MLAICFILKVIVYLVYLFSFQCKAFLTFHSYFVVAFCCLSDSLLLNMPLCRSFIPLPLFFTVCSALFQSKSNCMVRKMRLFCWDYSPYFSILLRLIGLVPQSWLDDCFRSNQTWKMDFFAKSSTLDIWLGF